MMLPINPASAPATAPLPRSVPCPACGYDLRAATDNRCSECGLVIDLSALDHTAIPWAYRQSGGRAKAFLKTLWLITLDARSVQREASTPQSASDAEAFRRWVTSLVTAALAGLALLMILADGIEEVVVREPSPFEFPSSRRPPGFEQDLLVPWSAGVALRPALFGYAVLVAAYLTGATGSVFRTNGMPPEQGEATRAMGAYAAAPLVWLLPAAAAFAVAQWAGAEMEMSFKSSRLLPIAAGLWLLLAIVALVGTLYRTGQWRARVTRRGYATGFLAMGELLLRWAVGVAVLLSVVPWCVGFLWIVLDSFLG